MMRSHLLMASTLVRLGFHRRVALLVALAFAASMTVAYGQRIWVGPGGGGFGRMAPKWAKQSDFDGTFLYCRGFYDSVRYEDGGMGWWTDYPGADNNFSVRLAELTRVHVKLGADRQPNFVVVSLSDPLLYRCPILFMEDVGTAEFTDEETRNLRQFFLKGGFLWVDDFWGSAAWNFWVRQLERVLPPGEFPIFDVPGEHPIMHSLYDVKADPPGALDQLLVPPRAPQHVGARRRQRRGPFPWHSGRPWPPHGADVAQHRYRRHLGTRGREP